MKDAETDIGWAQRLKDRRMQRNGSERIVRWIAVPASQKRRVGGRGLDARADGSGYDNVVSLEARAAG